MRARLGILTRNYKVLSGSELITLGIKDCNEPKTNEPKTGEPRIMVASAAGRKPPLAAQPGAEKPLLAGLMDKRPLATGQPSHPGMRRRRAGRRMPCPFLASLAVRPQAYPASLKIITGGQPILPPGFSAYAGFDQ